MTRTPDHDANGQTGGEVNASPAAPAQPERPLRRSPLATAWYSASRAAMLSPDALPVSRPASDDLMPDSPTRHQKSLEASSDEALEVPAYKLHPMDMYLIREAAERMNLSVADYVQIAPYLYAKCMVEHGR